MVHIANVYIIFLPDFILRGPSAKFFHNHPEKLRYNVQLNFHRVDSSSHL